ncbi:MAG TPA: DnaB-like helicase C-terminal domain-containing protein, partial [Alphaproteobacteria bacterium]|nr:DnaB-like helicase C-terminal domain-containing protein [Alphaproteobacteria bacterium]
MDRTAATVTRIADAAKPTAEYRQPPHNLEAEAALLGALLVNNKAYEKVAEFLRAEQFYDPVHGRIYDAVARLIERNQLATPVTLKGYFEQDGDLANVGGAEYLVELAAHVISVTNIEDYGHQIHDLYLRRQLIELGETVVTDAFKHDLDISAINQIEEAEKRLYDLATTGDFQGGFVPFSKSLATAIERAETAFRRSGHVSGVTTGLVDLDRKLGGLQNSDLLILAGRPSMGKTALATNIAWNAARAYMESGGKEGACVGFFSLEMSAEQLATRILSDLAQVPSEDIRRGEIREADFTRFVEASQLFSRVPFFIDDTPALSITAVRTRARRPKRTNNLGMLVIDYLQLLRGGGKGYDNRVLEISEITRGLKAI